MIIEKFKCPLEPGKIYKVIGKDTYHYHVLYIEEFKDDNDVFIGWHGEYVFYRAPGYRNIEIQSFAITQCNVYVYVYDNWTKIT